MNSLPTSQTRFLALIASSLALAIAATALLYGHRPGLGLAVFFPLLWAALALHRKVPRASLISRTQPLLALLAGAAFASLIAPSPANLLILCVLTIYASGHWWNRHLSPYWARLVEGAAGFFRAPEAIRNLKRGVDEMWVVAGSSGARKSAGWLARSVRIVAPVGLLLVPFVLLLGGGNAILGEALQSGFLNLIESLLSVDAPEPGRFFFAIAVAACAFSLLGNRLPQLFPGNHPAPPKKTPAPPDRSVAVWRLRLLLVGANALFLAANAADVLFLWTGAELPEGVTYSEFVHRGTHNLIACTLLAGAVLAILFRGPEEVTSTAGQRPLAMLWIVQNLALAAGVAQRLNLYIDAYGMSVLRVHLLLFLGLVAIGFVLLAIYVAKARPLRWLVAANALAVFGLFFVAQFIDVRGYVAGHNVQAAIDQPARAKNLDLDYLERLAPESWPAMAKVAARPDIFGARADATRHQLFAIAGREALKARHEDWRAWSWRRQRLRDALPSAGPGAGATGSEIATR